MDDTLTGRVSKAVTTHRERTARGLANWPQATRSGEGTPSGTISESPMGPDTVTITYFLRDTRTGEVQKSQQRGRRTTLEALKDQVETQTGCRLNDANRVIEWARYHLQIGFENTARTYGVSLMGDLIRPKRAAA